MQVTTQQRQDTIELSDLIASGLIMVEVMLAIECALEVDSAVQSKSSPDRWDESGFLEVLINPYQSAILNIILNAVLQAVSRDMLDRMAQHWYSVPHQARSLPLSQISVLREIVVIPTREQFPSRIQLGMDFKSDSEPPVRKIEDFLAMWLNLCSLMYIFFLVLFFFLLMTP